MPKSKNPFSKSKFYFDNCPVCRAVKNADDRGKALSLDELRAAFDEANG